MPRPVHPSLTPGLASAWHVVTRSGFVKIHIWIADFHGKAPWEMPHLSKTNPALPQAPRSMVGAPCESCVTFASTRLRVP